MKDAKETKRAGQVDGFLVGVPVGVLLALSVVVAEPMLRCVQPDAIFIGLVCCLPVALLALVFAIALYQARN